MVEDLVSGNGYVPYPPIDRVFSIKLVARLAESDCGVKTLDTILWLRSSAYLLRILRKELFAEVIRNLASIGLKIHHE
jgi:hypothetical protein